MQAPPVLTAERIDAMLSIMAEVCLESVVEAGQRQKAAEDFEAFERSGRTLQRACRNLRQTIAMKQRHDREEAKKADDARKAAEGVRVQAERSRRDAVGVKRNRVLRHFERVLWDEHEDEAAHEWFEAVDGCLDDLAEDPNFLETPVETLIQRLADDIGLGEEELEAAADRVPPPPNDPPTSPASSAPPDLPPDPEPRPAVSADPPAETLISEAQAPPQPPDPPPEPLSEPYVPPWERLAAGERMPGGSGW